MKGKQNDFGKKKRGKVVVNHSGKSIEAGKVHLKNVGFLYPLLFF